MIVEILTLMQNSNMLTPAMLAGFMAVIFYMQNKAISALQNEVKSIAVSLSTVSATLATTVTVLQRIDEYGTKSFLEAREADLKGQRRAKTRL